MPGNFAMEVSQSERFNLRNTKNNFEIEVESRWSTDRTASKLNTILHFEFGML